MNTRILSALALLPLAAGCTEIFETPPGDPVEQAAVEAAEAPRVVASAAPVVRPPPVAPDEPSPDEAPAAAPPEAPPVVQGTIGAPPPPPAAEEEEEPEEEAAAEAPPEPEPAPAGRLGTTVASLGSPTQGGLWLETALVSEATSGRIEYNGQSVAVQLRPSGGEPGSGSQISVEAMRALGAPLTSLPEIVVFSG